MPPFFSSPSMSLLLSSVRSADSTVLPTNSPGAVLSWWLSLSDVYADALKRFLTPAGKQIPAPSHSQKAGGRRGSPAFALGSKTKIPFELRFPQQRLAIIILIYSLAEPDYQRLNEGVIRNCSN